MRIIIIWFMLLLSSCAKTPPLVSIDNFLIVERLTGKFNHNGKDCGIYTIYQQHKYCPICGWSELTKFVDCGSEVK